jgi:hypothetical protein
MIILTLIIAYFIVSFLFCWFVGIIIWMHSEEREEEKKIKEINAR